MTGAPPPRHPQSLHMRRIAGRRRRRTVADACERAQPYLTGSLVKYQPYLRALVEGLPALPADSSLPSNHAIIAHAQPAIRGLGHLALDDVTELDLTQFLRARRDRAAVTILRGQLRRGTLRSVNPHGPGRGVHANSVDSLKWLWGISLQLRLTGNDPTRNLRPERHDSPRVPLSIPQLTEAFEVFTTRSDDPALDTLTWAGFLYSGARQSGLLDATAAALVAELPALYVVEKFGKSRYNPVPRWWLHEVRIAMAARGAVRPQDMLFRYVNGHALTGRRFDYQARLLKRHLPWAIGMDCGPHTLRHTLIDWLRHVTTPEVVAAITGHTEPGATRHYKHVTFDEKRQALEALFGPLDALRQHGGVDPIDLPAVAERLARFRRRLS